MLAAVPHYREIGAGDPLLCLHSSASSSRQWQTLGALLGERYRVLAADLYGYGSSPGWSADRAHTLEDEVTLIEPLLRRAGSPVHLVGHSYGGAVALRAALCHPEWVRSLTVYEPVVFSLLRESAEREIRELARTIDGHLVRGDAEAAARSFVEYWSGAGSFDALHVVRRARIIASIGKVRRDFDALFGDSVPLAAYREIRVPVLYLHGANSPRPTRQIAALLGLGLRGADVRILEGVGHLGPVTHPERVNPLIEEFLDSVDRGVRFETGGWGAESRVA